MKTVRIICGTYGHRDGAGHVVPCRAGSIIEVTEAEAQRLVKRGVAVIVSSDTVATVVDDIVIPYEGNDISDEGEAADGDTDGDTEDDGDTDDEQPAAEDEETEEEDEATTDEDEADLNTMTNKELKEMAEGMGLDTKNLKTKDSLIAAIEGAMGTVDGDAGSIIE